MPRLEAARNPIFCALDTTDHAEAMALGRALMDTVGGLKIGLEYCHANGPERIAEIASLGLPLFLDLKLNDIPNTVAGAMRAIAPLKPAFVTIHAFGGPAMISAAVKTASEFEKSSGHRINVLAVTVLTSLDADDLRAMGVNLSPAETVSKLAELATSSGATGIVCSPFEIARVRKVCGPDTIIVVPGIRPERASAGDQKRVMTPLEAMEKGADYLVIGRPITEAGNPADAAREIRASLELAKVA